MVLFGLVLWLAAVASESTHTALPQLGLADLQKFELLLSPQTLLDPNIPSRSLECNSALTRYWNGLSTINKNSTWALQMYDATAKIPEGILYGNYEFLGQYDECLDVKSPIPSFRGQYCKLAGKLNLTFPGIPEGNAIFFYGMCVPATCTADDLNAGLVRVGKLSRGLLTLEADAATCQSERGPDLRSGDWVVVGLLCFLGVLGLLSTIYDVYIEKETKNPLLTAFSLHKNGKTLFSGGEGPEQFHCLHGIKVCSIAWIAIGHLFGSARVAPIINIGHAFPGRLEQAFMWPGIPNKNGTKASDLLYTPLAGAYVAVDTFLLLSGFLLALSFFRTISRHGTYDAPLGYIHRYLRLTPSYAMVILFHVTVFRHIGNGPMWSFIQSTQYSCNQYWWSGLLYIQTYINPDELCLTQTWYLSADMQLYWISPFVFYPMWKWRKFAPYYICILIIVATVVPFTLAYVYGFAPVPFMDVTGKQNALENFPTYSRATPWLIGVALAVVVSELQRRKLKIGRIKYLQLAMWLTAGIVAGLCIFGLRFFETDAYVAGVEYSFAPAFFLAFRRLGWSFALCWLIFACINGCAGPINGFLSWSFFIPLGKLSYGIYLVHVNVLLYKVAIQRTNTYFNLAELVFDFASMFVLSCLVAMVLYLFVEAPFLVIDRHLLRNAKIFPYPRPVKTSAPAKSES